MSMVANLQGLSQDAAIACLRQTRQVWRQHNGEPLERGFQRTFGRPLPETPLLTVPLALGGRMVTVHLHRGGIAAVYDPLAGGWELRALKPDCSSDELGNMAYAMKKDPLTIKWNR